ncbi:M48 family metallopeptidase [Chryseomicrobium palamuruense]|uniref:M48 family metallopeptidase n=1 Tax=Chryseomicrobium palamuruense TaxID=682973 RepID=A0ABV8UWU9_9BACL
MQSSHIRSSREVVYFIISLLISISIYIVAAVSIVGIGIALIVFAIVFYLQLIMLGSIRGNGVRIHQQQFPDVYARVDVLAKEMGLKKVPDVFVIQSEGALNAFATRFLGRDMVVLYSEVFELAREQGQEELDFILAHELAHVKRRHVWKNLLILPAAFVPFLSQAYSRSCEYTCDRHAAYVIQNPQAARRALTLLGIGKGTFREVNENAYMQQIETESNAAVWLSEILSTHPLLPKRVQAISVFANTAQKVYQPRLGKVLGGAALLAVGIMAVYFTAIALFAGGSFLYGNLFTSAFTSEWEETLGDESTAFGIEGETPLMTAAYYGNTESVEAELAAGADLLATDADGSDALMYAVYGGNADIVRFLLDQGADPNTADNYTTVLTTAVTYGDRASAEVLLEYGADPSLAGPEEPSAFDVTETNSIEELLEAIESY